METKDKGQFVNYYDRTRRLERASENARFISEYHSTKKRGILRSLTATRSLRFLFFTTVLALVAVLGAAWLQRSRAEGSIAGSRISAKAMWYEGAVYLTVKRSGNAAPPYAALTVRAGVTSASTEATLGPLDRELKLRIALGERPGSIRAAVERTHPAGSTADQGTERVVLVVAVE